jgi:PAS domain S-box-containing protein
MLDGLVLTNIEGKVLDCNEALLEMVGITKEECIGKNAFDSVHPEYKQEITQQVQKVLEKGHCRAKQKPSKKTVPFLTLNSPLSCLQKQRAS